MDTGGFFHFDESFWPVLIIRQWGIPTNVQYGDYLRTSTAYLQRGERHLIVLELLQVRSITTEQLHWQVEWNTKHEALSRQCLLGLGYVMNSPFLRLALNVAHYLRPPVVPSIAVPRLEQALDWGATRLAAVGLRASSERIRQHPVFSTRASAG